jgi:hypothetical protein
MRELKTNSDTVTVTPDGRTIVDIPRLLQKEHIKKAIEEMKAKTTIVYTRRRHIEDRARIVK